MMKRSSSKPATRTETEDGEQHVGDDDRGAGHHDAAPLPAQRGGDQQEDEEDEERAVDSGERVDRDRDREVEQVRSDADARKRCRHARQHQCQDHRVDQVGEQKRVGGQRPARRVGRWVDPHRRQRERGERDPAPGDQPLAAAEPRHPEVELGDGDRARRLRWRRV